MRGEICNINGPVVRIRGGSFQMTEMVLVGEEKLIGEVIKIEDEITVAQVYEQTTGLKINETVYGTGRSMSITLGPGLISGIFDGIGRPLDVMPSISGVYLQSGIALPTLVEDKKWAVDMLVKEGETVTEGQIVAQIAETSRIMHKVMIPYGVNGTVLHAEISGEYSIKDVILTVKTDSGNVDITMANRWPIRVMRPFKERMHNKTPMITGQRIIDTLFPIAKGGSVVVPGGFGTGKTIIQHQLAKWSDVDVIVYVACGERGNEITQVLEDFAKLVDPQSGEKLMDRTLIIANTSNMPVAMREASIYTGITIAEYYRDMGYSVAIMADSTSRWAEALREISGRLEEMPAEEGFPAYMPSRLSEFYERAGSIETLCGLNGSITIIAAVSPQGGDFSEPVTQNTKRFVRVMLELDRTLAYSRHYPSINWLNSYSEYIDDLTEWYDENVSKKFKSKRKRLARLLREEASLLEVAKLIGSDVLPDDQKLVLEVAALLRRGFLQQSAFHKNDAFATLKKQFLMLDVILYLYERAKEVLTNHMPLSRIRETGIFEMLVKMKEEIEGDNEESFTPYKKAIDDMHGKLML